MYLICWSMCEDSYQDSQASQVSLHEKGTTKKQHIHIIICQMFEKMDQYGTKQKGVVFFNDICWFCHVILKIGVISCHRSTVI